ncbi:hypothetical protein [Leisingera caerulea]|uniref:hypothetical protein n=1 Tax=Leisingera caerulea TaxID=506591 RepID=UPI0021A460EB|nr:hypothetical protein [Leisingera caerulea]UWQ84653.1 hypothetical protein K3726_05470 [Leisingera caerulea]
MKSKVTAKQVAGRQSKRKKASLVGSMEPLAIGHSKVPQNGLSWFSKGLLGRNSGIPHEALLGNRKSSVLAVFRIEFYQLSGVLACLDQDLIDVACREIIAMNDNAPLTVYRWIFEKDLDDEVGDLPVHIQPLVNATVRHPRFNTSRQRIILFRAPLGQSAKRRVERHIRVTANEVATGYLGISSRNSRFHCRTEPKQSAQSIGILVEPSVTARITEKRMADEVPWVRSRVLEAGKLRNLDGAAGGEAKKLTRDTVFWSHSGQKSSISAGWSEATASIREKERATGKGNLRTKITALRQMSHQRALDFDHVIGAQKGETYLGEAVTDNDGLSVFDDYMGIRSPAGEVIDLNHLLVCIDARGRKERNVSYYSLPIGKSWSAATWAGDIGAGVTDARLKTDEHWESFLAIRGRDERVSHYFSSRVPLSDIWGNVDGWAFFAEGKGLGFVEGLNKLYGSRVLSQSKVHSANRKFALEKFLRHYRFDYSPPEDRKKRGLLRSQRKPRRHMIHQVLLFARIWVFFRLKSDFGLPFKILNGGSSERIAGRMVDVFLEILEAECRSLGCDTRTIG